MNVVELLYKQARLRSANPAIITPENILTYGRLAVATRIIATHLRQHGVLPGQVVGVSMGQNALHLMTLLALAHVGAISLPLHQAVPKDRRKLAADRFGATHVVSGRNEMALSGLGFIPLGELAFDGNTTAIDGNVQPVTADTAFRIAISSGTSGDPKGMLLTHGLVAKRADKADTGVDVTSRTMPMDLNFIVGLRPALSAIAKGGALVMASSSDPDRMLQTLVSHAVTHIYLSPAQARALVEPLAEKGTRCPHLICLRVGGGPLLPGLLQELHDKITPNVYVSYGSTESGLTTYATPEVLLRHPTCVGKVCDWANVEIVRDKEGSQLVPCGETGVVRIRSDHQVTGYYLDEQRNPRHFRHGWFYPGDLGRFDENDLLYIEGRTDDQLNVGGLKVNPEEIEAVLIAHPAVGEVGVFILAPEEGTEMLAAAIVLHQPDKLPELRDTAIKTLGPLAPQRYFLLESLPRTITGKLRRAELAARFVGFGKSS